MKRSYSSLSSSSANSNSSSSQSSIIISNTNGSRAIRTRTPPPPPPQQQQQQRQQPVIIYTHSPRVIHTHPRDFMALVQKLTGLYRPQQQQLEQQQEEEDDDDDELRPPSSTTKSELQPKNNNNNDNDETESSSVITTEDNIINCGIITNNVNSNRIIHDGFVSAYNDDSPNNPYFTDLSMFNPNTNTNNNNGGVAATPDLLCSDHFYNGDTLLLTPPAINNEPQFHHTSLWRRS